MSPFAFSKCGISPGKQIAFCCDGNENNGTVSEVADDRHVRFAGEIWSLTALAKHLLNTRTSFAGPKYFKYKGEWLNVLCTHLESRE